MPRTPENLIKHELIGLKARVISSPDASQEDIEGEVMDETQNTLNISGNQVPKRGRKFSFELNSNRVEISGDEILDRPEDRL